MWRVFGIGSSLAAKVTAGAIVVVLAFAGVQTVRLKLSQRQATSNALARDSAVAVGDSTRAVEIGERAMRRIFGDSVKAVERRLVQRTLERDALDKALKRVSITRIGVTGTIRAGAGTATGTVHTEPIDTAARLLAGTTRPLDGLVDSVRVADFDARQEPFTLHARARLPRAGEATLDWRVAVDPARMNYRVQCGEPVRGIRPATVVASGPPWLTLQLGELEQTPETCNAKAAALLNKRPWFKPRVVAGIGYGAVYEISPKDADAKKGWKHGPGGFFGLGFSF